MHPRIDPERTAFHRAALMMLVLTVFVVTLRVAVALREAVAPPRMGRYEPIVVALPPPCRVGLARAASPFQRGAEMICTVTDRVAAHRRLSAGAKR